MFVYIYISTVFFASTIFVSQKNIYFRGHFLERVSVLPNFCLVVVRKHLQCDGEITKTCCPIKLVEKYILFFLSYINYFSFRNKSKFPIMYKYKIWNLKLFSRIIILQTFYWCLFKNSSHGVPQKLFEPYSLYTVCRVAKTLACKVLCTRPF